MNMVAFAAVAAIGWGAADYLGGKASRDTPATTVVLLSQLAGLPVLAVWLLATTPAAPQWSSLLWGAAGGICGLIGMAVLYRALATEAMTVVAPVSAVTVAVVPLVAGLFMDAWPGGLALAGVCCAVLSIVLVNHAGGHLTAAFGMRAFGFALAAGFALGLQLVFIALPGTESGLWSMVGARAGSILCAATVVSRTSRRHDYRNLPWRMMVLTGVLDTSGFAFYLFALGNGLLSVVGPLVSLYPAATIVLALTVDGERVGRAQIAGLGLAASALVLVSV